MKRHGYFLYLILILCFCLFTAVPSITAGAASDTEKWVVDKAGLLDEDELADLNDLSSQLSSAHNIRLAIVTTPDFQDSAIFGIDFDGTDILDWEIAYFNQQSANLTDGSEDGLLLAVSMADRDWGIQSFGAAADTFNQYAREEIGSRFVDSLSDGDYYDAFETYLTLADEFLTEAENGEPYTAEHTYRESVPIPLIILGAFVLSLIISFIIVFTWKKSMNTRIRQDGAGAYLEQGSFRLTGHSDIFLYHHISRTRKEKNDSQSHGSTHSSSSGTRGKF